MPWLVCTAGPDAGLQLELGTQRLTLGRSPENVVRLADEKASRYHCAVGLEDNRLQLEDLNSTNGTKCGDQRLRGQQTKLRLGDNFMIGKDLFEFRSAPDRTLLAQQHTAPTMSNVPLARGKDQTQFETGGSEAALEQPPKRSWLARLWRRD